MRRAVSFVTAARKGLLQIRGIRALIAPLEVAAQDDHFLFAEYGDRKRYAHIAARNGQIWPAGLNFARLVDGAAKIMAA